MTSLRHWYRTLVLVVSVIFVVWFRSYCADKYQEFRSNSPVLEVTPTPGGKYGVSVGLELTRFRRAALVGHFYTGDHIRIRRREIQPLACPS